jgi:SAM-dependent methyltransferase
MFMQVAHERGFDPHGVDLAADAVESARRRPGGAKAFHGSPLEVPEIAAGGFDVITMWSVLAHLPRPVEDLTMLRGLLAPDGVLLVLTINANSLALKRQLDAWGAFTPGHLKFFSPDTLRLLLRRAGFGAVVFRTMYSDDIEAGTSPLPGREQRRLRRAVDRGNRGGMLRAVAFADSGGPERWAL